MTLLLALGLFLAGMACGAIVEGRTRQRDLDAIDARIQRLLAELTAIEAADDASHAQEAA